MKERDAQTKADYWLWFVRVALSQLLYDAPRTMKSKAIASRAADIADACLAEFDDREFDKNEQTNIRGGGES